MKAGRRSTWVGWVSLLAAGLAVVASSGCSKGPREKLQGTWVGEHVENIPVEQEARANGWARHTSFEFHGDEVTISVPAQAPRKGTFKVTRASGNRYTLAIMREGQAEPDEAEVTLREGNKLSWQIGNDRNVMFSRKVASAE